MRQSDLAFRRPLAMRTVLCGIVAAVFGAGVLYVLAILLSGPLLAVAEGAGRADVLVVLGGDGPARSALGAALWHKEAAPKILVTGDGDCLTIAADMVTAGVPPAAITTECASGSTWQNAEFSAPILKGMQVRNAIIVTSWFHGRRALASFDAFAPQIDFSVASTPPAPFWQVATGAAGEMVAEEYPKTAFYALRLWIRTTFEADPA